MVCKFAVNSLPFRKKLVVSRYMISVNSGCQSTSLADKMNLNGNLFLIVPCSR